MPQFVLGASFDAVVVFGDRLMEAYHSGTYTVHPREKLILYTDGVTEAVTPENEMFGDDKFASLLQKNAEMSPEALCRKTVATLWNYQQGRPFDDITLLILERT